MTINELNKQKTYTCGGVYGNENPAQNETYVHRLKEIDWSFSFIEVLLELTINTCISNAEIAIPELAPEPARPMKWPEPTLLANKEAPTYSKGSIYQELHKNWLDIFKNELTHRNPMHRPTRQEVTAHRITFTFFWRLYY